jgi:probable rRNA maturation factor
MVNVLISTDTRYPVNRKIIRKAVADAFKKHRIEAIDGEVSVSVVGERKMKGLSAKYLGDDNKHEVLAFALEEVFEDGGFINPPDEVLRLGDVVLCWPQVLEAASREDVMVDDEVYFLTAHAVDHLLGQHH